MNWRAALLAGLTILIGLAALSLLYREERSLRSREVPAAAGPLVDYYIEGVQGRQYNTEGVLAHSLDSPRIEHMPDSGRSRILSPTLRLQRPDGSQWQARAGEAEAVGSTAFSLRSSVVLERGGPLPLRVETEQLEVREQGRIAETDAAIRFLTGDGEVTATGLRADLDSQRIDLKKNLRFKYVLRK